MTVDADVPCLAYRQGDIALSQLANFVACVLSFRATDR